MSTERCDHNFGPLLCMLPKGHVGWHQEPPAPVTDHVPLTDEELAELDDWYGHGPINWATGQRLIADLRAAREGWRIGNRVTPRSPFGYGEGYQVEEGDVGTVVAIWGGYGNGPPNIHTVAVVWDKEPGVSLTSDPADLIILP